jgi:FdhD protein
MNEEVKHFVVQRMRGRCFEEIRDALAVEEPLEIRLNNIPLAVVMRTPGHDFDLARGFLLTEGILQEANGKGQKIKDEAQSAKESSSLQFATCNLLVEHARDELGLEVPNVINCRLPSISETEISGWQRHIFASSSCGICGRASIDRVRVQVQSPSGRWQIPFQILQTLPDKLRQSQTTFTSTGGLHAAAFFTPSGEIIAVREDIGRHNAVDKILGWAMRQKELSLENFGLLVSGRLSFELVQKALIGGIAFMAGISAASSLAVELAEETGLTLAGFLRGDTAVVYSNPQRILF